MRKSLKPMVWNEPLPKLVGAAEAEQLLGISRTTLHVLAKSGKLPGRVIDKPGIHRYWQFKTADVFRLKETRYVKYQKGHRVKKREAWARFFGGIPNGFTVACRDRNESKNTPALFG
jgi:hypothetical protein